MTASSIFRLSKQLPLPLLLLVAFAGALNVLAFAPFHLWPLQILLLAALFHLLVRQSSVKRSALIGWIYGSAWLTCGVHWLFISMHDYGGMPAWMAALAVVLLSAGLSILTGIAMGAATWIRQRWELTYTEALLVVFPALWMLSEWVRGWIFTGFPWVVSGYAHTGSPLAGFAPIIGVYGIGWLAAMIAGCLALLPSKRLPLVLAFAIFCIGFGLNAIHWTQPNGQPISVRLIQGNVPQEMKFDIERISDTLGLYQTLVEQAPADLIATPETAIPLLSRQLPPDYLQGFVRFAHDSNSHLAIGIPLSDGPQDYANSVIGLTPQTANQINSQTNSLPHSYRYDKHHLVPFGEFIPTGFRWFVNMMRIPLGDFTRGAPLQAPFQVKDQWVLPNICYEDLFGEEIADQIAARYFANLPEPTLLLNMSNIAWFGDSVALPQHLQISQMRALETGRPMLRATNTGTTAVIDPKGHVIAQLPTFERGVLTASVQGYQGVTPYILLGNTGILIIIALLLAITWLIVKKKRSKSHSHHKNR